MFKVWKTWKYRDLYDIIKKAENEVFTMKIKIDTQYITLAQFLKMADLVSSGGEAKYAVKEMDISVNGEKENRRGRKLYKDDQIIVDDNEFVIV